MNDIETLEHLHSRLPIVPRPRRFVFHSQDAELLGHFATFHFLRPLHVALLTQRHIVSCRRRLRQLHEQGFLVRLRFPLSLERAHFYTDPASYQPEPPDQAVYFLSHQGLRQAQKLHLADEALQARESPSLAVLGHDLQLSHFHAALQLACRQHSTLRPVLWEQRRSILYERFGSRTIDPDALFALKRTDRPERASTSYFFLEIERAKPTYEAGQSTLLRKAQNYLEYRRQNRCPLERDIEETDFGFHVIFCMPTRSSAENLGKNLRQAGLGKAMFWITDAGVYQLTSPLRILEPGFATAEFEHSALYSLAA